MKCKTCSFEASNQSEMTKHMHEAHPELFANAGRKPAAAPAQDPPAQQPEPNVQRIKGKAEPSFVCDSCGGQLIKGQKYCAGCGTELSW